LSKEELVQRIRTLAAEVQAERLGRGALAYDQQALLARILRLEAEIILMRA
jgi:hypothetical protein